MGIFFSILVTFVFICNVDARPISYSGGHTLMHFNDSMKESIYYHYSPTYKFSIGLETMQNKVFSINETNIRFTYLLNRKNTKILEIISITNVEKIEMKQLTKFKCLME